MLEERKGHNYQYYSDQIRKYMSEKNYSFYEYHGGKGHVYCTQIESDAKNIVNRLRNEGNYARIICGYEKDTQRNKYYSIIYKAK
jgi:hypothetical protein